MHAFGRDFDNEDEMDDYIDYLIEEGILEEDGFDEDGNIVYICNYKMMKESLSQLANSFNLSGKKNAQKYTTDQL